MHRHGYKGRKFGRQTDQRRALIKGLADALVLCESIETTLPKAKETARYTEKLVTKAKKGGLHNRRQVISGLASLEAANKLVDELAPKLTGRNSGYFSVKRTDLRTGDGAQLARVSFVDKLDKAEKSVAKQEAKPAAKKEEPKKEDSEQTPQPRITKEAAAKTVNQRTGHAPKRTGRRGNR